MYQIAKIILHQYKNKPFFKNFKGLQTFRRSRRGVDQEHRGLQGDLRGHADLSWPERDEEDGDQLLGQDLRNLGRRNRPP